ncbi:MAG: AAA family ATPase [Clostridium sp.]|nr:AAA family ATPase [Clostridium sp.]
MTRTVAIGIQSFEKIIANHYFYIDKTDFIREWWESGDDVTLITRPRRFGKTLNLNMLERFFSMKYKDQGQIFEELSIWKEESYRSLQGTYPVLALSFADIKEPTAFGTKKRICQIIEELYNQYDFLLDSGCLNEKEKESFGRITVDMNDYEAAGSLKMLSLYLARYYKKNVIILLDEYDTPLQEAYLNGYWKELVEFTRSLFNSTFKTNPYLERSLMTGITRISKESVFSDVNNLEVVTATSEKYEDSFGFTQEQVWEALREFGLYGEKQKVKDWYDGFTFGKKRDIYNPWSILNYLDKKRFSTYWANTSSNSLTEKLIREGGAAIKETMEDFLKGGRLCVELDEQIMFSQLDQNESAVWSLFLAGGYLKAVSYQFNEALGKEEYELALTNREVRIMFEKMIRGWFGQSSREYNGFIRALLQGNKKEMNACMNRIALTTFSYFDTGNRPSGSEPERFYHGFVLGLMVELTDRYVITSNRESGFGRYDVVLKPRSCEDDAIILEFKVHDHGEETDLADTVRAALKQIEEKDYKAALEAEGVGRDRIRSYGFAFEGKRVLIG